jgi:hypothetical protein
MLLIHSDDCSDHLLWAMTTCRFTSGNQRFGGTCRFHHQGWSM